MAALLQRGVHADRLDCVGAKRLVGPVPEALRGIAGYAQDISETGARQEVRAQRSQVLGIHLAVYQREVPYLQELR